MNVHDLYRVARVHHNVAQNIDTKYQKAAQRDDSKLSVRILKVIDVT